MSPHESCLEIHVEAAEYEAALLRQLEALRRDPAGVIAERRRRLALLHVTAVRLNSQPSLIAYNMELARKVSRSQLRKGKTKVPDVVIEAAYDLALRECCAKLPIAKARTAAKKMTLEKLARSADTKISMRTLEAWLARRD